MQKALAVGPILAGLLVMASLPQQAMGAEDPQILVLLVGDNCQELDHYMAKVPHLVACTGEETLWQSMVMYHFLIEHGYKLVYVVDYSNSPIDPKTNNTVSGLAYLKRDYALAVTYVRAITHEALHLLEDRHCTSDGIHDHEAGCQMQVAPGQPLGL